MLLIESGGSGSEITNIPNILKDFFYVRNVSRVINSTVQRSGVCNGEPCKLSFGHILGGASVFNNFNYARIDKATLADWSKGGVKGWAWDDILPFMKELETYEDTFNGIVDRGTRGPVHATRQNVFPWDDIRKRWKAAAIDAGYQIGDYNGPRRTYFTDTQKAIHNGVGQSTDQTYLRPIMGKRANLHVIMLSHVTRILFDSNKVATGVEYSRNGKLQKVRASREVIVSAGPIGSPQLLMLSGIGPAGQLDKFNIKPVAKIPGVGHSLQDHLKITAKLSTNLPYPPNSRVTKENYDLWRSEKKGILAAGQRTSLGFLASQYSVDGNDTQIVIMPVVLPDEQNPDKIMLQMQVASIRTKSRGHIELRSSNPFDDVKVDPNYMGRQEDRSNAIAGMKVYFSLMKLAPFAQLDVKLVIDEKTKQCSKKFEMFSDEWFFCFIQKNSEVYFHFSSTCRMGGDGHPMAVVDDRLRVRQVKKLRVVDSSIMPQVVRGSSNIPSMIIGLKGADMIRRDNRL